jgi:hypothetical protein
MKSVLQRYAIKAVNKGSVQSDPSLNEKDELHRWEMNETGKKKIYTKIMLKF